jgi:hypothetical protein
MTPLGSHELGIRPVGCDQLGVALAGDHPASCQLDNAIGIGHGRQPVLDTIQCPWFILLGLSPKIRKCLSCPNVDQASIPPH